MVEAGGARRQAIAQPSSMASRITLPTNPGAAAAIVRPKNRDASNTVPDATGVVAVWWLLGLQIHFIIAIPVLLMALFVELFRVVWLRPCEHSS